jgi:hypothetical protein
LSRGGAGQSGPAADRRGALVQLAGIAQFGERLLTGRAAAGDGPAALEFGVELGAGPMATLVVARV